MKAFDFFRKVDQDIQTTTSSGGAFSILAAICGVILFISEFREFRQVEKSHELFVDHDFDGDFRVNLNVTFLRAPCQIISIQSEDELGQHNQQMNAKLQFTRLSKTNETLPIIDYDGKDYVNSKQEMDDLINSIKNEEQCMVTGSFVTKKTPGNFNFGFKKKAALVSRLHGTNRDMFRKIVIDHTINSLYFGDLENDTAKFSSIYKFAWIFQRKFNVLSMYDIPDEAVDPYPGLTFKHDGGKYDFENHMSILPVHLDKTKRSPEDREIYQYNIYSGGAQKGIDEIPSAYYRYKMNPVSIKYSLKKKSTYHFIVQTLAIVGGVFSVLGILYHVANSVIDKVKKM